jgi:Fe-S cluster biogenesis protein NfuA
VGATKLPPINLSYTPWRRRVNLNVALTRRLHRISFLNSNQKGKAMEHKIRAKLEELRERLKADGGDLEVVSINNTNVQVRLTGACGCCPHATMTIKQGLERILRDEIDPRITVEQVK